MKLKIFLILLLAAGLRLSRIEQPARYLFDEDMHAYTANLIALGDARVYEWWHQPQLIDEENRAWYYRPPAIEWLHPPVSKLLEAASIKVFGNQPFAWRIPAMLAGYGLVILLMLLSWQQTRSKAIVLVAGGVGATDRLFLVQSRLASTDIFVVFFIALTMLFFWRWRQKPNIKYWLASAVALGLAGASKWSGWWLLLPLIISDYLLPQRQNKFLLRWLVFLGVSLLIYVLSFGQMWLQGKTVGHWLQLHKESLWYQQQANFDHPQSSRPSEWLIGQKPVWYWYHQDPANNQLAEIKAQPSRAYLYLAEIAVIAWLVWKLGKRERRFAFDQKSAIFMCFIFSFLPWIFINRPLFIYHFLPSYFFLLYLALTLIKPLQKVQRANFFHHLANKIFK